MKMTKRAVTFLAASAVLVSQAVVAAPAGAPVKLTQVQGDVMVSNGTRFVKAVPGLEIKSGAKIVTAKSSNVSLVYGNGCVKELKQNTMHTVGTPEQCAAGFNNDRTHVAALGNTPVLDVQNMTGKIIGGTITFGSVAGLIDGFSQGDSSSAYFPVGPYPQ